MVMVEMAVNSIKGGPSVAGPDEEDILYSRMNNSRYLIGVVLMIIIVSTVSTVHAKQVCQRTTLYVYTQPIQTEKTILCHPDKATMKKASDANILFNDGIVAAQHSSLTQCPNSDKSFCSGWDWEKKYG
jgi:hypothetical protein